MNQLEIELRNRTEIESLLTIDRQMKTVEEGRELIAKIDKFMSELISEMREKDLNNEDSQAYSDVRYDLKTARHNIHYKMMKIVKEKRRAL